MATNTVTDLVVNQYIRQPVPQDPEGMAVYLSGQLQEIENSMKTVGEGSLQVVDQPPARPLKGMLRYAVTPWDPLGTGFQGLVVYSGNAWLRASDPESLISDLQDDINANATAVSSLTATVTSNNGTVTALAQDVVNLSASLTTANGNISANASAVSTLTATVTSQGNTVTALASDVTSLQTDLTNAETGITANSSAVSALTSSVTSQGNSITALASDVTTLQTGLTNANGSITANSSAVSALTSTVTSQGNSITALASDVTTLQTGLTTANGNISANSSAVSALTSTVTSQGNSITSVASDVTTLQTDLTNAETDISANSSAVSGLTSTVTSQGNTITAQASDITTLSTTVGNQTSSITSNTSSINGIEAKHTVKIDNNGHISGYGLISTANNGTPTSTFDVAADAFRIGATDSSGSAVETVPFAHYANARTVDGVTMPAGTYIENLFVEGARIKSLNADVVNTGSLDIDRLPGLSQLAQITSASQVDLQTNNSETTFTLTTGNLTAGSKLLIMASFSFFGTSASNNANGQAFFESTGLLTDSTNTWNRFLPAYNGNSSSSFTFNGFAAAVKNGSDGAANIKIRIKNIGSNNRTIRIPAGLEILVLAVEK